MQNTHLLAYIYQYLMCQIVINILFFFFFQFLIFSTYDCEKHLLLHSYLLSSDIFLNFYLKSEK